MTTYGEPKDALCVAASTSSRSRSLTAASFNACASAASSMRAPPRRDRDCGVRDVAVRDEVGAVKGQRKPFGRRSHPDR